MIKLLVIFPTSLASIAQFIPTLGILVFNNGKVAFLLVTIRNSGEKELLFEGVEE